MRFSSLCRLLFLISMVQQSFLMYLYFTRVIYENVLILCFKLMTGQIGVTLLTMKNCFTQYNGVSREILVRCGLPWQRPVSSGLTWAEKYFFISISSQAFRSTKKNQACHYRTGFVTSRECTQTEGKRLSTTGQHRNPSYVV